MFTNNATKAMPVTLSRFQDAFEYALLAPDAAPDVDIAALIAQPAFAVYRNTVMKGCIDALQANFPAVTRLVGEEWFRAAASVFVRQAPPTNPILMDYGASFADFLTGFGSAAELPYLPAVARLDRCWTEAHSAPDDVALDPALIAELTPEALASTVLRPHAAARWAWFADAPIYTIWSRNRADETAADELEWKPEGALLVRPRDVVQWITRDAAGCAFLDACAKGCPLAAAADAALESQKNVDLSSLLSTLLAAGAFSDSKPDFKTAESKG